MLARVLAAAKQSGVAVSPVAAAFSLAAADAAQKTKTISEGPNFVVQSWGTYSVADERDKPVTRFTIENDHGAEVTITNFGATLLSFKLNGRELTINHPETNISASQYAQLNQACYGSVCGRVANRISQGKFELDGKKYELAVNNGPNHLHGGPTGFHRRVWDASILRDSATGRATGVSLSRTSPDGEEGYPSTLQVTVQYLLHNTPDNALEMRYEATTDGNTPINLTNHTYWNLNGGSRTVHDHVVTLNCSNYLPVTDSQIPTGELRRVEGTDFDFKSAPKPLACLNKVDGCGQPGFDHCFAIDQPQGTSTARLNECAVVQCDGVRMTVATTQPGVQLYTANWLNGKGIHRQHMAFCLETQNFPDAINQRPKNGCDAVLQPGDSYRHVTKHTFARVHE